MGARIKAGLVKLTTTVPPPLVMDLTSSSTANNTRASIMSLSTDTTIVAEALGLGDNVGLGLAIQDTAEENWVSLKFSHAGKEYTVDLADSDR